MGWLVVFFSGLGWGWRGWLLVVVFSSSSSERGEARPPPRAPFAGRLGRVLFRGGVRCARREGSQRGAPAIGHERRDRRPSSAFPARCWRAGWRRERRKGDGVRERARGVLLSHSFSSSIPQQRRPRFLLRRPTRGRGRAAGRESGCFDRRARLRRARPGRCGRERAEWLFSATLALKKEEASAPICRLFASLRPPPLPPPPRAQRSREGAGRAS
jgi:hypothetical protein